MFEIIETRNSYGNCYKMNTYNDNKIITTNEIQIKSFNSFVDDKCIIMLYSSSMQPIDNAIDFLNWGMNNASENYILQSITALKLLHSYLEIFNVSLDNMDKKQALGFLDFIKGMSHEGFLYTTKLTTIRKNESVSCYLKVIRKYIEFLGYDNHVLLKRTNISRTILLPETDSAKTINTYFINVKTNKKDYVPAYINIDEYKRIIDIINKSYTLRDKVIVRLMYEHGLRLGEVLGLTLEDFKQKENNDFLIEYSVELRNRLTDTREQKAKTCMKVFSDFDYKDKNYKSEGVGYHKIILSEDLALELIDYINEAHTPLNSNYLERYNAFSKADSVLRGPHKDNNFYIFLNTLGKPLSENLWNKQLRQIFLEANLSIDYGIRQNNLSHRFRHGYAMNLTNILKASPFEIQTLMRHKQLSTTAIYQNPTPEDIANLQKDLINEWKISILEE